MTRPKVLIIDDERVMRETLCVIFSDEGYEVSSAENGLEGLRLLSQSDFDVIILDVMLPELDGYKVCRLIKNNPRYQGIPIILLTAKDQKRDKFWGLKAGADEYIAKPFDPVKLIASVSRLIGRGWEERRGEEAERVARGPTRVKKFDIRTRMKSLKESIRGLSREEIESRLWKFSIVAEVLRDLSPLNNLEVGLSDFVEMISALFNSEILSVMLRDEETDTLTIKAAKGLSPDVIAQARQKVGENISGWVAKTGRPLLISDISKDKRFVKRDGGKYYNNSLLSVPLKTTRQVLGVINVNNKRGGGEFNEFDLELLLQLADQLAAVLEKAFFTRGFKEEDLDTSSIERLTTSHRVISQVNELLDSSLYKLTIINEVAEAVNSTLDREELIRKLFGIMCEVIDFETVALLLTTEGEVEISIEALTEEFSYLHQVKKRMIDAFEMYTGGAVEQKDLKVRVLGGRTNGEDSNVSLRLGSYLLTPIYYLNNPTGVLGVFHSRPNLYSKEDEEILSIVTKYSAVALENAKTHQIAKRLSITDELTRLHNYRYLRQRLSEEIKRCKRYGSVLSIILIDLDDFKEINDTFGHQEGDRVLRLTAEAIKRETREVDISCRYGGEEFAVILPQENKNGAFYLAERMREAVRGIHSQDQRDITISLGIASFPEDEESPEGLLKKADQALYLAKAKGKNVTCCFQGK